MPGLLLFTNRLGASYREVPRWRYGVFTHQHRRCRVRTGRRVAGSFSSLATRQLRTLGLWFFAIFSGLERRRDSKETRRIGSCLFLRSLRYALAFHEPQNRWSPPHPALSRWERETLRRRGRFCCARFIPLNMAKTGLFKMLKIKWLGVVPGISLPPNKRSERREERSWGAIRGSRKFIPSWLGANLGSKRPQPTSLPPISGSRELLRK